MKCSSTLMEEKSVHNVTFNLFFFLEWFEIRGSSVTVGFVSCKQKSGDFFFYTSFAEDIQ